MIYIFIIENQNLKNTYKKAMKRVEDVEVHVWICPTSGNRADG